MPENACRTPVRLPQATIYAGVQLVKAFDKRQTDITLQPACNKNQALPG